MEEDLNARNDLLIAGEALEEHSDAVHEDEHSDESTETVLSELIEEREESIDGVDVSKEDGETLECVPGIQLAEETNGYGTKQVEEQSIADEISEQSTLTNALEDSECRSADLADAFDQSEAADVVVISEEPRCEEGEKMRSEFAEPLQVNEIPMDSLDLVEERVVELAVDDHATAVEEDSIEEEDRIVQEAGELVVSSSEGVKEAIILEMNGILEEDDAEKTKELGIESVRIDELKADIGQSQVNEIGQRGSVEEVIASNVGTYNESEKVKDSIFGSERENIANKSVEYFGNSQKETEIANEIETNNIYDRVAASSASWRNCCGILDVLMKSKK